MEEKELTYDGMWEIAERDFSLALMDKLTFNAPPEAPVGALLTTYMDLHGAFTDMWVAFRPEEAGAELPPWAYPSYARVAEKFDEAQEDFFADCPVEQEQEEGEAEEPEDFDPFELVTSRLEELADALDAVLEEIYAEETATK